MLASGVPGIKETSSSATQRHSGRPQPSSPRGSWRRRRVSRDPAELRGLLGFVRGLGLDEATVREIYEAVGREAMATGASDDDRMAEVRKRMLAAARDG